MPVSAVELMGSGDGLMKSVVEMEGMTESREVRLSDFSLSGFPSSGLLHRNKQQNSHTGFIVLHIKVGGDLR